jgi:predicted transcriptional regulator
MSPYRSKERIIIQILTMCQEDGISKTQIVYRLKTDFDNLNLYLDLLTKKGMLEIIQSEFAHYKTTTKGEKLLESLRAIAESCS